MLLEFFIMYHNAANTQCRVFSSVGRVVCIGSEGQQLVGQHILFKYADMTLCIVKMKAIFWDRE
jgi:hypothetical protein